MGFFDYSYIIYRLTRIYEFIVRHKKLVSYVVVALCVFIIFSSQVFGYSAEDQWSIQPIPYDNYPDSSTDFGSFSVSIVNNDTLKAQTQKAIDNLKTKIPNSYTDYYFLTFYQAPSSSGYSNIIYTVFIPKSFLDTSTTIIKGNLSYRPSSTKLQACYFYLDFGSNFKNLASLNYSQTYYYSTYSTSLFQSTSSNGSESYPYTTSVYNKGSSLNGSPDKDSWYFYMPCSYYNPTTHTAEVPINTDIPYQILFQNDLGDNVIWGGSTMPYLANTSAQLAELSSTVNIVTNGVISPQLTLVDRSNNVDLFTISLSDSQYEQYYRRLDLNDPFSDLAYMLPISALPSFTYNRGRNYDWKLTYYIGSTGPYVIHHYITSAFSSDGPVGGGVSPYPDSGSGGGGSGGGESSGGITSDDLDNLGNTITGSIEESTDRLLSDDLDESSMDIDTSVFDSVDSSNVFDLLYKLADLFSKAFAPTEDVYTIKIPISSSRGGELVLSSDIISSNLPASSFIVAIIGALWTYLFGRYLWTNAFNIIESIKDGSILDGNLGTNEVITDKLL